MENKNDLRHNDENSKNKVQSNMNQKEIFVFNYESNFGLS